MSGKDNNCLPVVSCISDGIKEDKQVNQDLLVLPYSLAVNCFWIYCYYWLIDAGADLLPSEQYISAQLHPC